jgi:predicted metal-dependent hydrolase
MTVTVDRIVRSKRRTLALIVEDNGSLTVRAPMRMPATIIQEFVAKHTNWVQKKQSETRAMAPIQPKQYQPGENFLYLGREYELELVQDQQKKLVLDGRFLLAASVQDKAELVFQNWYRQQARQIISERVKLFANKYAFHYDRIRITSARTRWGSCSTKGTLNFSWRLIMTPLDIVDYVIIHELAHTVHHNHSKRFWGLVKKILPDYKDRRKHLKEYGQQVL